MPKINIHQNGVDYHIMVGWGSECILVVWPRGKIMQIPILLIVLLFDSKRGRGIDLMVENVGLLIMVCIVIDLDEV